MDGGGRAADAASGHEPQAATAGCEEAQQAHSHGHDALKTTRVGGWTAAQGRRRRAGTLLRPRVAASGVKFAGEPTTSTATSPPATRARIFDWPSDFHFAPPNIRPRPLLVLLLSSSKQARTTASWPGTAADDTTRDIDGRPHLFRRCPAVLPLLPESFLSPTPTTNAFHPNPIFRQTLDEIGSPRPSPR